MTPSLPRRTPWTSSQALIALHGQLYSSDVFQRQAGLGIISLWLNRGPCPASVESTSALIRAQMLHAHLLPSPSDLASGYGDTSSTSISTSIAMMNVRTTYAMAIVRFVNSVVDAHQNGMFAQSIASIARRIGLPTWFVDLRHAATHEDLPSLQVLQDAAAEALDWLHHHYWYPTLLSLNPASRTEVEAEHERKANRSTRPLASSSKKPSANISADRASLRQCLRDYSNVQLDIVKDRSLAGPQKPFLEQTCKKVVKLALGLDEARSPSGEAREEVDLEETPFLDLVELLVEENVELQCNASRISDLLGSASTKGSASANLLCSTWQQLLTHTLAALPALSCSLSDYLVDRLCPGPSDSSDRHLPSEVSLFSKSGRRGSSALVMLVLQEQERLDNLAAGRKMLLNGEEGDDEMSDSEEGLAMHVAKRCLNRSNKHSVRLAKAICRNRPELENHLRPLLHTITFLGIEGFASRAEKHDLMTLPLAHEEAEQSRNADALQDVGEEHARQQVLSTGFEDAVNLMAARLKELQARKVAAAAAAAATSSSHQSDDEQVQSHEDEDMRVEEAPIANAAEEEMQQEEEEDWSNVPGWSRASKEFKPCPIGWPPADLFLPI